MVCVCVSKMTNHRRNGMLTLFGVYNVYWLHFFKFLFISFFSDIDGTAHHSVANENKIKCFMSNY